MSGSDPSPEPAALAAELDGVRQLREAGEYTRCLVECRRLLPLFHRVFGAPAPESLTLLDHAAACVVGPGSATETEALARAVCGEADEAAVTAAHYLAGHSHHHNDRPGLAADSWRVAAAAGHPHAQNSLGFLHAAAGRENEAEGMWQAAAASGHARAAYNLGLLLAKSGRRQESEMWLRRAARGGHAGAQTRLDRDGVPWRS